jgi:hypothetical protein
VLRKEKAMSIITIVRTDKTMPQGAALDGARDLLFGAIDGAHKADRRAWRMFWKRVTNLEPGEMAVAEMRFPRSGQYHRRHMKIESSVFDAQERFTDFEQFRYWLKVGAAWVTWAAGPKGGVVPIPKSISYAKADEAEFREYHDKVIDFLRGPHASKYLWPHLPDHAGMMEVILAGFGE